MLNFIKKYIERKRIKELCCLTSELYILQQIGNKVTIDGYYINREIECKKRIDELKFLLRDK